MASQTRSVVSGDATGTKMTSDELKWARRRDFILAVVSLIAGGLIGASFTQFATRDAPQFAQAIQKSAPPPTVPAGKDGGPAESKPGGVRPTTPAPEPALPDTEARKDE